MSKKSNQKYAAKQEKGSAAYTTQQLFNSMLNNKSKQQQPSSNIGIKTRQNKKNEGDELDQFNMFVGATTQNQKQN